MRNSRPSMCSASREKPQYLSISCPRYNSTTSGLFCLRSLQGTSSFFSFLNSIETLEESTAHPLITQLRSEASRIISSTKKGSSFCFLLSSFTEMENQVKALPSRRRVYVQIPAAQFNPGRVRAALTLHFPPPSRSPMRAKIPASSCDKIFNVSFFWSKKASRAASSGTIPWR